MTECRVIGVMGISGVGKTFNISQLIGRLPNLAVLRASEIIGAERQNKDSEYLRTLPADEILRSQELLVRGFRVSTAKLQQSSVLLDAHSVIDSDNGFIAMPVGVFRRLNLGGCIHIEDDPDVIVRRRNADTAKVRPSRSIEQIARYQDYSRNECVNIASALNKRCIPVKSGDIDGLKRAVQEILA